MKSFDIRRLYLYVVSFATLLMIIFSGVRLVRTAVEMLIPPVPMVAYPEKLPPDAPPGESPEEWQRRREQEMERNRQEQRRFATVQLVDTVAMLLIATPLYLYHWRLAQRSEANSGEASS